MKIIRGASTFFVFLIISLITSFSFAPLTAYAHCGYKHHSRPCYKIKVIEKTICKPHPKKHHVYKKHRRYTCNPCRIGFDLDDRCRCPCARDCAPQREFVEFIAAPAPNGCYVDLDVCENYAPDRITGDDDPMVYPGMNIDE